MQANKREIFLTNGSFKDGIEIHMNGLLQQCSKFRNQIKINKLVKLWNLVTLEYSWKQGIIKKFLSKAQIVIIIVIKDYYNNK